MRPPIDPQVLDALLTRPTPDELREHAIVAFTDAVERPHAGRVGEALDALARWLREELHPPVPMCAAIGCTRSPGHYGSHGPAATGPHGAPATREGEGGPR